MAPNFSRKSTFNRDIFTEYEFLLPSLGEGAFGKVFNSKNLKSGINYAVKMINKKNLQGDIEYKMLLELNIMHKLDHINILKVIDFYEDKENYYIVMDLCTGGDLFDYLIKRGSLDESIAATLM